MRDHKPRSQRCRCPRRSCSARSRATPVRSASRRRVPSVATVKERLRKGRRRVIAEQSVHAAWDSSPAQLPQGVGCNVRVTAGNIRHLVGLTSRHAPHCAAWLRRLAGIPPPCCVLASGAETRASAAWRTRRVTRPCVGGSAPTGRWRWDAPSSSRASSSRRPFRER
jgi:hypothetical protein